MLESNPIDEKWNVGGRRPQGIIVSTTTVYPSIAHPNRGIFVARRLAALHAIRPVMVVAPRPWFPLLRPLDGREFSTARSIGRPSKAPDVLRPSMFYLPGVFKHRDADYFARALRPVIRAIRASHSIVAIDAHFEWPDAVGAWIVARENRIPFLCTLRGKLVSAARHSKIRRRVAEMLRDASGLIAVSQSLADLAARIAGTSRRIRVIPNGIDRTIFNRSAPIANVSGHDAASRSLLGWDSHARYVVAVGHIQRLKGFHRLVDIWPEVRARVGDIRLILVGDESGEPAYSKELRRRIARVNKSISSRGGGCIRLLNGAPPMQIACMLNAADLFALTSESEGWCNAIAESLACGCPVVATDVGGNRELVSDPDMGMLVPLDDRQALVDAVVRSLTRSWNRRAIASAGGERDWKVVGRQCAEAIDDVTGRTTVGVDGNRERSGEQYGVRRLPVESFSPSKDRPPMAACVIDYNAGLQRGPHPVRQTSGAIAHD
ncbi:MAG: glycosyltransferase [Phycisphaerae bacterium]|nr:glycosyltransferase [Phycisphaerae bacterium]